METIGAKIIEEEKTCNDGSSSDRISSLPADIQHHILSFLPIKFVARTSVLSRRWSSLWASFPILDFYSMNPLKSRKMNFEFISSLLQRRDQNSRIKVFRVQGHLSCSCLHDCIDWVVRHSIEELTLEISLGDKFDLPSCVFNCDSVRSLNLMGNSPAISNSQFRFPSSYVGAMSGMRSLRSLRLIFVEILESASVGCLFSGSSFPFLENLSLMDCQGITHLKITCPNIKHAQVVGMHVNSLEVSGLRLESLDVKSCFNRNNNGNWVNIFAPNLKIFKWVANFNIEIISIQNFPTLRTANLSGWLQPNSGMTKRRVASQSSLCIIRS